MRISFTIITEFAEKNQPKLPKTGKFQLVLPKIRGVLEEISQ